MESLPGQFQGNHQQRILLVDDEAQITRALRRSLTSHGYEVQVAADGAEALATFRLWQPDLVVADLAMPNMSGLELCRRLRAISAVPVIVLSATSEERAKVEALDAGADDYLTKPFGMDELLARLRVLLRRSPLIAAVEPEVLAVGDFHLDRESRHVTVQGRELRLTPKEYELLLYFLRHPHKALAHRTLLTAIRGDEHAEQTEYLRVFVGQLRKKIEADPAHPRYILTEPWFGYRFTPDA